MSDIVERLRGDMMTPYQATQLMDEAADRIEQLEAEVKVWQGHAKTAIWSDSEECKSLSAEVDRLVRSRNKWGQRYNKLLLKIRAGENGDFKIELKDCYADLQKLNERNAEYIGTIDRLRRRVAETDVEIERLRAVMKTAIRQFEDGNLLSCHRTLCDEVHGRQK